MVRHYISLSILNHHVDRALYPLGSCTMKYNPKVNDAMAALTGFAPAGLLADHCLRFAETRMIDELELARFPLGPTSTYTFCSNGPRGNRASSSSSIMRVSAKRRQ